MTIWMDSRAERSAAQLSEGLSRLSGKGAELSAGYAQLSSGTLALLCLLEGMRDYMSNEQLLQASMLAESLESYGTGLETIYRELAGLPRRGAAVGGLKRLRIKRVADFGSLRGKAQGAARLYFRTVQLEEWACGAA